jgi:tRNA (guanine-N7-)-methyltransferase
MTMTSTSPGEIRTFHLRRGRLGVQRREWLRRLGPRYGVAVEGGPLDPEALYGRRAPLVLEIGSGMGDATAAQAADDPDRDYLAAEVHSPGVANLLGLIEQRGLTNLRVYPGDALRLLRERVPAGLFDTIQVFFPDPWPKHRHHKRRLFQPRHVELLRSRLRPGGVLHVATDWPEYAQMIRQNLEQDPALVATTPPVRRHRTKYEQRALEAGRPVTELAFRHRPGPVAGLEG